MYEKEVEFLQNNINLIEKEQYVELMKKADEIDQFGEFWADILNLLIGEPLHLNLLRNLKAIPDSFFYNSIKYPEKLVIPNNIIGIHYQAFRDSGIKAVNCNHELNFIKANAFRESKLQLASLPTKKLEYAAFYNCSELEKINLGNSITEIPEWCFAYCEKLAKFTIPETVTKIESNSFEHCKSLQEINLPHNLEVINTEAFRYCNGLQSIEIPSSVTEIDWHAFSDCPNLRYVKFNSKPKRLDEQTFTDCDPHLIFEYNGNKYKNIWELLNAF